MKETYVTVTGFYHYYGLIPFKVGKVLKCVKEPSNPYDDEAIRVTRKGFETVGYIANTVKFKAVGTDSAGKVYDKVKRKFWIEVMFITSSKVICKVIDGFKDEEDDIEEKEVG